MSTNLNLFLQINELRGASTNPRYPGTIDIDSFTFGVGQKMFALSQGLNDYIETAPSFADMTVTRSPDAASDRIMAAAVNGRVFPKAVLIAEPVDAGRLPPRRLVMTMSSVLFTSYQSGSGSPNSGRETLTLSFQNIHISHT